jgi:hypothetical protein
MEQLCKNCKLIKSNGGTCPADFDTDVPENWSCNEFEPVENLFEKTKEKVKEVVADFSELKKDIGEIMRNRILKDNGGSVLDGKIEKKRVRRTKAEIEAANGTAITVAKVETVEPKKRGRKPNIDKTLKDKMEGAAFSKTFIPEAVDPCEDTREVIEDDFIQVVQPNTIVAAQITGFETRIRAIEEEFKDLKIELSLPLTLKITIEKE